MISYSCDLNCPQAINVVGSIHRSGSELRSSSKGCIRQQDAHIRIGSWSSMLSPYTLVCLELTRASPRFTCMTPWETGRGLLSKESALVVKNPKERF
jgi:hypothetical protein